MIDILEPSLRFPEFKDKSEWVDKQLGNVCISYSGGTPLTSKKEYYNGDIPFIRSAEIDKEYTELFLTKEGLNNSSAKIINKGDILVALYGANSGDVAIAKINGAINQAILCLKSQEINHFIYYFLLFKQKWIISKYIQGGQGNLSGEIIKSIKLLFPSISEQQKIADCLSSLDEFISAENQKLEAYKVHKKGLMQQLFPGEGEKVPKMRFEEFKGEWKESTFGDAAKFINGRAYKQEELLEYGKYRVLRVGNFFTNNNWYYSDLELEADKYCEEGDLLYAWSASFGPRIWKGEKTIYHYHIWKVVSNDGIDKNYLFKLLDYHTEKMKSQNANGFALLHITKGNIESWKCYFPKSEKEQQKIASFLSSLDELIIGQTEKIGLLKEHKKGLMQGMFPNV